MYLPRGPTTRTAGRWHHGPTKKLPPERIRNLKRPFPKSQISRPFPNPNQSDLSPCLVSSNPPNPSPASPPRHVIPPQGPRRRRRQGLGHGRGLAPAHPQTVLHLFFRPAHDRGRRWQGELSVQADQAHLRRAVVHVVSPAGQ